MRGQPLPLPAHALARGDAGARRARRRLRLDARASPSGPGSRAGLLVPVPALGRRRGRPAALPRAAAGADGRDAGRAALPRALAGRGPGRRSSGCSTSWPRSAAARPSCGTTTASTASTAAAGAGVYEAPGRGHAAARRLRGHGGRRWPRTGGSSDARPDRLLLLPAGRRGRRAARAQALPAPAGAGRRGGRAGAGRPQVRGPRPRARGADPGRRRPCTARPTAGPRRRSRRRPGWPRPTACARLGVRAAILGRGLLLPDPEVAWVPAATARRRARIVGSASIDVVLTTSPPASVHLVGAAARTPHRVPLGGRPPRLLARQPAPPLRAARGAGQARRRGAPRARRILRRVDAVSAVTQFIADEAAALAPAGTPLRVVPNGCDFDDFDGLVHAPRRAPADRPRGLVLRPAHAAPVPGGARGLLLDAPRPAGPGRGALPGRVPARPTAPGRWALGLGDALASRASARTPRRSRR